MTLNNPSQSPREIDFAEYVSFNKDFEEKYAHIEQEFPFSFMALESELRNHEAGFNQIVKTNISKLTHHYWPVDLLTKLATYLPPSVHKQFYVQTPSFKTIRDKLERGLAYEQIGAFSNRRFLSVKANKLLRKIALGGPQYPRFLKYVLRNGLEQALAQHDRLRELERAIEKNFARLLVLVKKQRICGFLATGDFKPSERLLCHAAATLDIPYFVLAHSYLANPKLISVAPIRANKLIVWTELQRAALAKALPASAAKIISFGYPFEATQQDQHTRSRDDVLFIWEPILSRTEHFEALEKMASACLKDGLKPIFRAHPKERQDAQTRQILESSGFDWDEHGLTQSLRTARFVVSTGSTALTHAVQAGVPGFLIKELAKFNYEGTQLLSVDDFPPQPALLKQSSSKRLPDFDTDALLELVLTNIPRSIGSKIRD